MPVLLLDQAGMLLLDQAGKTGLGQTTPRLGTTGKNPATEGPKGPRGAQGAIFLENYFFRKSVLLF